MTRPLEFAALDDEPEKPQWGVRLGRGVVTYFNDAPLVTWEQAMQAREKIEAATGEFGEVEKVYVL